MACVHPANLRPAEADGRPADPNSDNEVRSPPTGAQTEFVLSANELLTVIGRDGCFKRVAPLFPPAFGYVEADMAATGAAVEELTQGHPTLGLENRFRCKDGSYRRLTWTAIPTAEGLLYAVARDITDRSPPDDLRARSLVRDQTLAVARKEELLARCVS